LEEAWKRVKRNGGAGGIDKVSITDVKAYGEEKLLDEIAEGLWTEKYRCKPVRRTYIPKADGKKRALGIPTIKDRIVQMAAKIVIEPVFEADFQPFSYGFRPKRSALQAMDRIFEVADKGGALWVIDADIKDYFGSISHDKLLLLVEQRITDRKVLKLIKGWLKAQAEEALKAVKWIMNKLELTLHSEKTKLVDMYFGKDSFDFLGFNNRFQRFRNKSWKWYWTLQQVPSQKAMEKMRGKT
jgi:group II intron reverse transcriptase/maturase